MNNGELYKQAFGALRAPDTISLTAEKGAERKTFRPGRRLVLVCACTVLALGLAVTAYARGGLILGHVFGWGNNMEVTTGIDENGESYNEVRLHTENLTPPVVQRGGRMIFIVNNESIDITGELSRRRRRFAMTTRTRTAIRTSGSLVLFPMTRQNYGYAGI